MRTASIFTLVLIALTSPAVSDDPSSQRDDEARSILERTRLYRERHGVGGALDSQQMLERTRWGYQRWLAAERRRSTGEALDAGWVSLGPVNSAGRMTALSTHPVVDGTVLAGAASGGLWKTTDHGASWRPLTDGLSDLSVGAVAYAPSDPDVVYLGTGEAGLGGFFVPGIGMLRSPDGGETWFLPDPGAVVAEQFFALSVDPRDPDRVLAGTERGLYATTDGGVNWQLIVSDPSLEGVTELVRSAADPDRLWAALWCFSTCPDGLGRIMTSADGGETWSPSVGALPDALLNNPTLNRIALAVAPSDDRILYTALNTGHHTPQGPEVAIYRSDDGGASWRPTTNPGPYLIHQGWYDNELTVDPEDPDVVLGAGVWYVRSTDGGVTWSALDPFLAGDWMGTETLPHVDGHIFAWQDGVLWLGCDGGVWSSTDRGATWTGRNSGLVTRQFYGIATDPIRRHRLIGGTQDNKTNLRTGDGDDDWAWVLDGDGFDCAVNSMVPDVVYGTIYATQIFRSYDGGVEWTEISPSTGGDPTPFLTPLVMRRDRPWELFTGSSRVWRSTDAGDTWHALGTAVAGGNWSSDVVRSVAVTPDEHHRIVIAKGTSILASDDGGATWLETPTAAIVNSVAISAADPLVAVAGLARTEDGSAGLLRSSDGGRTWYGSATGLPPFAVPVVAWHPTDPAVAFAGTDVGLYRSTDGGLSWTPAGDGLPAVSVHDVVVEDDGSRVVVGTHGRGIWELNLFQPPGAAPEVELSGPQRVFLGEPATYTATASDGDGEPLALRFLSSLDWRIRDAASGGSPLSAASSYAFSVAGEYVVGATAEDASGRTGFDAVLVEAFEPGDSCATPRVIAGAGPFPATVLSDTSDTTIGADDPEVPCTTWPGDPDAGRWGSIWFEFTPEMSGTYTVSTCGSTPDTAISAWRGPACGPYEAVDAGCNDDDRLRHCRGRDTDSWIELELTAGDTIRLLIGGTRHNELGHLRLTVDCPSCESPAPGSSLLVPAAARTAGAGDSDWTSGLQLVNPSADEAAVAMTLLPGPGTGAASGERILAPGAALTLDDVVGELTGGDGAGALHLEAPIVVAAASRTWSGTGGSSYGQGIPALDTAMAAAAGEAVRLFGFGGDAGFRTNLGLVNPGGDAVGLAIRFYDRDTSLLAEENRSLGPGRWLQLNRVLARLGIAGDAELAVIRQTSRDGAFSAYASVVDDITNDPTFLGETAIGRVGDPLWIPASAHVDGLGGARWRTDLHLFNPATGDLLTRIELVGPEGTVAETTVHAPEGWLHHFPDVVAGQLDSTGVGALKITPTMGLVMATSRTFADGAQGSYGQGIPGVAESEALAAGETGILPGLRQDDRFRTNIGLVNIGPDAATLRLTAHDADGAVLKTVSRLLDGGAWLQLNQPLPEATAYAVVDSTTPGARFFAYASVVDRATDDPTYIAAVPAAD